MYDKSTVTKDWGLDHFVFGSPYVIIRRLEIKQGGVSTFGRLHRHRYKFNRFYVESGLLKVFIQKGSDYIKEFIIGPYKEYRKVDASPGEKHRFEALEESVVYEIYWSFCPPNDIVRDEE